VPCVDGERRQGRCVSLGASGHLLWDTAAPEVAVQRRSLKRSSQDCRLASAWPLEPSPHHRHTVHVTARPTACAGAEPPQQPGCWVQTQSLQPQQCRAAEQESVCCPRPDTGHSHTFEPPRPTADARLPWLALEQQHPAETSDGHTDLCRARRCPSAFWLWL
jgi:hypothetical protein